MSYNLHNFVSGQKLSGQDMAEMDAQITKLKEQLSAAETKQRLAVQEAVREKEAESFDKDKKILALESRIENMETDFSLREQRSISERDFLLKQKDEEIAFYKDMKTRMSTKMVGETL